MTKKSSNDIHLNLLLQNARERVLSTSISTTAKETYDHAMDKTLIDIGEEEGHSFYLQFMINFLHTEIVYYKMHRLKWKNQLRQCGY